MVNILNMGSNPCNLFICLLLIQKSSKHKKKKQKKEKDEKEKKKKKRHHHHHHHSEGDGRDSVQNGTMEEEEEPLPVSCFPAPLWHCCVKMHTTSSESELKCESREIRFLFKSVWLQIGNCICAFEDYCAKRVIETQGRVVQIYIRNLASASGFKFYCQENVVCAA